MSKPRSVPCRTSHTPLAACIAAIFSLSAPMAIAANTWTATSCDDDGPGTLRAIVGATTTVSGDTVDLTELPTTYGCSVISLQTGAIKIAQTGLILQGPGADNLTIRGKYTKNDKQYSDHDRIFNHTGVGGIGIYGVTITEGYLKDSSGTAKGGCIYSQGNVILKHDNVYFCGAYTDTGTATGGAIYTAGALTLKYSTLETSIANGGASGKAIGGGATAAGEFLADFSTISGNFAIGADANQTGFGGGLYLKNSATIVSSAISGNTSGNNAGGVQIANTKLENLITTVTNSTISGNSASNVIGGLYSNAATVRVRNSTIAFNTAGAGTLPGAYGTAFYFAPGVSLSAPYASVFLDMQSTLISNNTYGSTELDLSSGYTSYPDQLIVFDAPSSNNLIRAVDSTTQGVLPHDTIQFACPLIGPLRDNGGPTLTHALLSTSAAIDAGNNVAGLSEDQRGLPIDTPPYLYTRQSGTSADIGAYEVQKNDIVFNSSLEGCQ